MAGEVRKAPAGLHVYGLHAQSADLGGAGRVQWSYSSIPDAGSEDGRRRPSLGLQRVRQAQTRRAAHPGMERAQLSGRGHAGGISHGWTRVPLAFSDCPADHRGELVGTAILRPRGTERLTRMRKLRCAIYTRKSSEE